MKVLMLLANGFEESEAIVPADILKRAGAEVQLVSVEDSIQVVSTHGIKLTADCFISEVNGDDMDALILPGGMPGAETLSQSFLVKGLVEKAAEKGIYVAAICAAPFVLGKMGLLDGRKLAQNVLFRKSIDDFLLKLVGHEITAGLISAFPQGIAQCTETKESIIRLRIHRIRQRGHFLGWDLTILHLFQTQFGVFYCHCFTHD